jgi:NADH-quinone oxidoreductase subunit J
MIAAISLTLRARKDSKYVNPADQVRVKARDRMTVVKMAATQTAPVVTADADAEKKQ